MNNIIRYTGVAAALVMSVALTGTAFAQSFGGYNWPYSTNAFGQNASWSYGQNNYYNNYYGSYYQNNYCNSLTPNLYLGSSGTGVIALQQTLASLGYFNGTATGYYGFMTLRSVAAFQARSGLPSTGYFGSLTYNALRQYCGGTTNPYPNPQPQGTVQIISIDPTAGPVGTQVTITGNNFGTNNTIHFGSGVIPNVPVYSTQQIQCFTTPCYPIQTLKFTVPSSLNPACMYSNPRCYVAAVQTTPGQYPVYVETGNGTSNSTTFTVTSDSQTNALHIDSMGPVRGPVGDRVTLRGTGFSDSTIVRFGEGSVSHTTSNNGTRITFNVPDTIAPYCAPGMYCAQYLRQVTPGTYDVYVQNADGSVKSNTLTYTVESSSNNGGSTGTFSITGLDAPSTLPMGTTGTWHVNVNSSSANQNLHYSVVWGDENLGYSFAAPQTSTVQTSATFTHVYRYAGTFTPVFTVTDDYGHTTQTSATVVVTPWY